MSRSPAALLLLALWVAGLVAASAVAARYLRVTADLRLFLPAPGTPEQRLLLEGLGEGPAARVLAVALSGASPEELADVSRALVDALRGDDQFAFVANGDFALDALPEELLPYRFLLSPTLDDERLDESTLRATSPHRQDCCSSLGCRAIRHWSCHACWHAGNRRRNRAASSTFGSIARASAPYCSPKHERRRSIPIVNVPRSHGSRLPPQPQRTVGSR
jgi:hypothetical protein